MDSLRKGVLGEEFPFQRTSTCLIASCHLKASQSSNEHTPIPNNVVSTGTYFSPEQTVVFWAF